MKNKMKFVSHSQKKSGNRIQAVLLDRVNRTGSYVNPRSDREAFILKVQITILNAMH